MPSREQSIQLLHEYTESPSLRKHALAVEAAMRSYAKKYNADEELFGLTGLLHDFDYERYPALDEHTVVGAKILRQHGYSEELIHAIQAHNEKSGLGIKRESQLDHTLFACDEICGFITAVALVRPSKSLADLKPKSVTKKFKDKHFAAAVSREDIVLGAQELGVEMGEHLELIIKAMLTIAADLELDGRLAG
jgi:putative nucleotidyltransferase with HDIG domain